MRLIRLSMMRGWNRVALFVILGVICAHQAAAGTVQAPLMLRLFLNEGGTMVSFGEFTRTPDLVVFAMPVGGPMSEPNLQVVSLPATAIDWSRTDGFAATARYHHYVATRGEDEFRQLTEDAARTLNLIAFSTEPAQALELASRARTALVRWPGDHFGYRAADVEEIVWLLDESIGSLRARLGVGAFDVSLTARTLVPPVGPPPPPLAPLDLLNGMLAGAHVSSRPADRMVLLQAAMHYLDEARGVLPRTALDMKKALRGQIRDEQRTDARYARWSVRVLKQAANAASNGRAREAQAAAMRVIDDDRKMGQRRPDVVGTLLTAVQQKVEEASALRLQRDRRELRRGQYAQYERATGPLLTQIEKLQPVLTGIRHLEGPPALELSRWLNRLAGGGRILERQIPPEGIAGPHGMLVGAWHLAEQALRSRQSAIAGANQALAAEASSAAAGALMLISSAQREYRAFVDGQSTR
ncbi:MAG: hypothetical protein HOP14_08180 [Acidobacteria bacterium]|nr:hypothetical protein [Acidobacteriota bacterium]